MNNNFIFNEFKHNNSFKLKFVMSLFIIIIIFTAGIYSYMVLRASIKRQNHVVHVTYYANEINNLGDVVLTTLTDYITKKSPSDRNKIHGYLEQIDKNINEIEKQFHNDRDESIAINSIKKYYESYKAYAFRIIDDVDKNKSLASILPKRNDMAKISSSLREKTNKYISIEFQNNKAVVKSMADQASLSGIMLLLLLLIIGLLTVLSFVILSRVNILVERNNALKALASSEEKYNKAFRYSADVIGIISLIDERYIEVNDSFFRIFGYSQEEVIGHSSKEFSLWKDDEGRNSAYCSISKNGTLNNMECAWVTKSGEVRIGITSSERVKINNEPCLIFVWHDITERKKAEESLQKTNTEMEIKINERTKELKETIIKMETQHEKLLTTQSQLLQSEKMASLGALTAGLAHEINNPTNYVYISSKTLEKDIHKFRHELMALLTENSGEVVQYFERCFEQFFNSISHIINGSTRIRLIIRDMQAFSRLGETSKKKIYLSDALNSTVRLVQTQYSNKITFQVDVEPDIMIECFPTQINQVFLNIIMNGCQAIIKNNIKDQKHNSGNISITAVEFEKEVLILFEDNGIGMSEETKLKIFEPFFTTKPVGEGTGLGMSVSYTIIENHGGKIDIESALGAGTIITVHLPKTF